MVDNLAARDALPVTIGSEAYVVDSDDGTGNYINQWSLWIYTSTGPSNGWVALIRQPASTTSTQSSTSEYTLTSASPGTIAVESVTTGGRITLITIEVSAPFAAGATLEVGYDIPSASISIPAALMTSAEIDLTTVGTYSANSDILFGTDTPTGDVNITATFVSNGSISGSAQIIVSYV